MEERRMLIVDDEKPIRLAIRQYFRAQGWEVDEAADPEAAIGLLGGLHYDVVIADLRLDPRDDQSGFRVVREARDAQPDCFVVMLTAYGDESVMHRAWDEGAHAFFLKPIALDRLSQLISALPEALGSAGGHLGGLPS